MTARLPRTFRELAVPPEDPVVNAMLLCDHVHRDPTTGKHTLLGVLDTRRLPVLPAVLDAAAFYLSLTNLNGTYRLELAWLRGDTEEELARLVRASGTVGATRSRVWIWLCGSRHAFRCPSPVDTSCASTPTPAW